MENHLYVQALVFFVICFMVGRLLCPKINKRPKENRAGSMANLKVYCFECEIERPVVHIGDDIHCKKCGLIH